MNGVTPALALLNWMSPLIWTTAPAGVGEGAAAAAPPQVSVSKASTTGASRMLDFMGLPGLIDDRPRRGRGVVANVTRRPGRCRLDKTRKGVSRGRDRSPVPGMVHGRPRPRHPQEWGMRRAGVVPVRPR